MRLVIGGPVKLGLREGKHESSLLEDAEIPIVLVSEEFDYNEIAFGGDQAQLTITINMTLAIREESLQAAVGNIVEKELRESA